MKKIITSGGILLAVLLVVAGATTAYFSDTETSSGNTLAAGGIDLGIDNESYYNGAFNPGTSWDLDFNLNPDEEDPTPRLFFNFNDLKPGDWGEDTISLHVYNNDSWACMNVDVTATDDNGINEPESKDGDTTGGIGEGELQNEVNFVWWADDGDNVLEDDESETAFVSDRPMSELDGMSVTLADPTGGIFGSNPLSGSETYYIGKAWCFGNLTLASVNQDGFGKTGSNGPTSPRGPGIVCDGSGVNNMTQTDSVEADITFMAIQSRSNSGFKCQGGDIACDEKADVMLVLDRSGSINSTELGQLKTAANAFVDTLAPSADGVHVGQSSFSTTGTLDTELTGVEATIEAGINALINGGLTNLYDGITLATTELGSVRDRNDGTSPDVMVIVTDGNPNEPGSDLDARNAAAAAADAARLTGIEVYVVGVGGDINATYLIDEIADDAGHYFAVADFSQLQSILENIAICSEE